MTTSIKQTLANIITGNLIALSNKLNLPLNKILTSRQIVAVTKLFHHRKINNQGLAKILEKAAANPELDIDKEVENLGLLQLNDEATLLAFVKQAIAENSPQVEQYKAGNEKVIGFLMGKCIGLSKGRGNPQKLTQLLKLELSK